MTALYPYSPLDRAGIARPILVRTRLSTQLIHGSRERNPGAVSGSSRSLHGGPRNTGRRGPASGRHGTRLLTEEAPQTFGRRLVGEPPCVRTTTRCRAPARLGR